MIRLEARLPDQPITWGTPGIVEVTITNTSEEPVTVNARLAPGYRDGSSRELFAEIYRAGTDEPAAVAAMDYDRHPPMREDYRELAPGESLHDSFDLLDWYRMSGPGEYEAVISYQADEPLALDVPRLVEGIHSSPRVPFVIE